MVKTNIVSQQAQSHAPNLLLSTASLLREALNPSKYLILSCSPDSWTCLELTLKMIYYLRLTLSGMEAPLVIVVILDLQGHQETWQPPREMTAESCDIIVSNRKREIYRLFLINLPSCLADIRPFCKTIITLTKKMDNVSFFYRFIYRKVLIHIIFYGTYCIVFIQPRLINPYFSFKTITTIHRLPQDSGPNCKNFTFKTESSKIT